MLRALLKSPHDLAVLLSVAVVASIPQVNASPEPNKVIVNTGAVIFTQPAPLDLKLQNNDRSTLPAQICGIVGAYCLTLVIIGICLLTFGRRMRREAQYGSGYTEVEMIRSPGNMHDPSPMSPASTTKSWMRKLRGRKSSMTSSTISPPISPGFDPNHASFDNKIMRDQKDSRQREMELLYQAVMEHDKKKSTTNVAELEDGETLVPDMPMSPASPQFPSSPHSPHPKQIQFEAIQAMAEQDARAMPMSPVSPQFPASPLSPPPQARQMEFEGMPMSPASPQFPASPLSPPPQARQMELEGMPMSPASPQFPSSPLSPHPKQMQLEAIQAMAEQEEQYKLHQDSAKKPKDKRVLRIDAEREIEVPRDMKSPISPYSPGNINSPVRAIYPPGAAIPAGPQSPTRPVRAGAQIPVPPKSTTGSQAGISEPPRSTKKFARPPSTPGYGLPASPRSVISSRASQASTVASSRTQRALRNLRLASPQDEDDRQPLSPGAPTPQTGKSFASTTTAHTFITEDDDDEGLDTPRSLPRVAPQRNYNHPLNADLRNQPSNNSFKSASSAAGTLPLRNPAYGTGAIVPPTPVKTTYVMPKLKKGMQGPRTAGLTPMTGAPATPYSPYMPFTPVTPITPRLVGRKERKMMNKENKKRVMTINEGDMVKSADEMFGGDY